MRILTFVAVYSNKPVGHGVSSWTLEEVYMETCHVLSGLSRKCGLHLLSPASSPEFSRFDSRTDDVITSDTRGEDPQRRLWAVQV